MKESFSYEHPHALFSIVKTKAEWVLKCPQMEASLHFRSETEATGKGAANLDGQSSHTQSLAATEIAPKHRDVMLSLPYHTTHLGVMFFKLLNTYMASAI
jgi:hypothetical protein